MTKQTIALNLKKDHRHLLALSAAGAIYDLPNFNPRSAETFLDNINRFLGELPKDYEFYHYLSEPQAGLKFMILKPLKPTDPWVISVAGTQGFLDSVVDIGLGKAQFTKLKQIVSLFTTCQYQDELSHMPLAMRELLITGHSLGGGLAQALAYEIQRMRLAAHLAPMKMEVVTFNGFGARQLVERYEHFQPEVAPYLNATNYFVKNDPVSCIGTHIGPTYQLTPPHETPDQKEDLSPSQILKRHMMKTIENIVRQETLLYSGLYMAIAKKPDSFWDLTRLGAWAAYIPRIMDDLSIQEYVDLRVFKGIVTKIGSQGASPEVKRYVRGLIFSEMNYLKDTGRGHHHDVINQLQALYKDSRLLN